MRWAVGSNFVLNGTVKPDFSQVEADATQIAADARFALFYPEKRPFFVEGAELFNVPNTLVYTRTIVQPDGAAKVTGKLGRADVAVLSAFDQPASSFGGERPLVDIVRLVQNFGEQSLAGLLYSDRVGGGRANRVFGGDTHIVFGRLYFAQFQAVESVTRRLGGDAVRSDVGGGARWDGAELRLSLQCPRHLAALPDGQRLRAARGFIQPNLSNRLTFYGRPGALVERFNVFFGNNGSLGVRRLFPRAQSARGPRLGADAGHAARRLVARCLAAAVDLRVRVRRIMRTCIRVLVSAAGRRRRSSRRGGSRRW